MVNQFLQYPINPHFFQPLLPGFQSHLNIPVAFFSQHVEGINDHNKTAKLRSDATDRMWLVKVDGLKFTDGWEDFASAHDLRVGDVVVLRHGGDMVFHVTPLGPSCCEIEYAPSLNMDDQTNIGNYSREKKVKKSATDHSRFVTKVSTWSLKSDHMYIPRTFARSNGLHEMCGKKIVLLNEEGRSWKLSLKTNKRDMHTYARLGWKRFCAANEMSQGHYTFKLVQKSEPLVIRLCRAEYRAKQRSESESSSHHSCFEGSVIHTGLYKDKLYLPRNFVSSNGLEKGCSEVVLKNKEGRRWTLGLKHYKSTNLTFLKKGWNSFCHANRIKLGDSFMFELVGTGNKPVLSLCSVETNRDKIPSGSLFSNPISRGECSKSKECEEENNIEDKTISQKCLKNKKRKYWSRCRYSVKNNVTGNSSRVKKSPRKKVESSSDLSSFVANVTASSLRHNQLHLPLSFARSNGLDKMSGGKIVLLNEEGRSWKLILRYNKTAMQTYAISGWKNFCTANRMNQSQQYTFKLVQKSGPPIMRLCLTKRRPKSESSSRLTKRKTKSESSSRLTKRRPKSESSSNHTYYVGSVSPPSLKRDKLYLRKSFVISSGLDKGRSEIVLKNELGRKWKLVFKHYKSNFVTILTQGWRSFCLENGLKAGDSFKFRLGGTTEKPVLYLCSTESKRDKAPLECPEGSDDIESLSLNSSSGDESSKSEESDEESISQECLKIKKRKYCSSHRGSSSNSQNRFVILTLTPNAFSTYKLYLPPGFTLGNAINKTKKITLLGQNGVKQVVNIYQEKTGRLQLGKGWREYCESQGIKIDESFVLELVWGEEATPVLKFCNKVKST